jgi:hypothetical protein
MSKTITDLTVGATPVAADLFETSQNVSTTPVSRKVSAQQLKNYVVNNTEFGTGVIHSNSSGVLSSSSIVNADIDAAAAIVDTKLATISTAGKVSNSATTATSSNTASAIVARDGSGEIAVQQIMLAADGVDPMEAVTVQQLNAVAGGLTVLESCRVATTANLTATYANGASGVGATLTNSGTQVALAIDGVTLSASDRVLVKNQSTAAQNGVYSVTNVGSGATNWVLTRTTDFDTAAEIKSGSLTIISEGAANIGSSWLMTSTVVTVGTDAINWTQFTSSSASFLLKANNLSDLPDSSAAIVNLGLTGGAESIDVDDLVAATMAATSLSTGIVHSDVSGNFTSSTIVNADVNAAAGIVDTKLATISTAGKVSNSATTATSGNTVGAIVARDASGNFSAGTITASVTGASSLNVLKAGDTMTGVLTINPATNQLVLGGQFGGTTTTIGVGPPAANRAYVIPDAGTNTSFVMAAGNQTVAGTKTFSSAIPITATTNQLVLGTTNTTTITSPAPSSSRTYTIPDAGGTASFVMTAGNQTIAGNKTLSGSTTLSALSTGVVHSGSGGELTSSAIVNADVDAAAAIVDTKLATISTAGKVSNSATTATSSNTNSAIVARDGSGNFSAGTITATITGAASLNLLKTNNLSDMQTPLQDTQIGYGNSSNQMLGSNSYTWNNTTQTNKIGNSSAIVNTTLHLQSTRDIFHWLEADTGNEGAEGSNPIIMFSQDANNTACSIGYDTDNKFRIIKNGTGSSNDFIITVGATLSGGGTPGTAPTLSSGVDAITITGSNGNVALAGSLSSAATTNQLVLGTTNTTTITSPAPSASRVYTIPDAGGAASFVMTAANQTIAGTKTFSSAVPITATTNQIVLGTTNTTTINSVAPSASRVYTLPDFGAAASFVLTNNTVTTIKTGTYTPTIGDGTNNFTMTNAEGWYSQIGDTVHFSAWLNWSGKGSATGAMRISLPFNISGTSFYRSSVSFGSTTGLVWTVAGKDATLIGSLVTGSNYVQLSGNPSDGAAGTTVSCNNCLSAGNVIVSGTYRT